MKTISFFYLIHYENLTQYTKMKLDKYVLINKENVDGRKVGGWVSSFQVDGQ